MKNHIFVKGSFIDDGKAYCRDNGIMYTQTLIRNGAVSTRYAPSVFKRDWKRYPRPLGEFTGDFVFINAADFDRFCEIFHLAPKDYIVAESDVLAPPTPEENAPAAQTEPAADKHLAEVIAASTESFTRLANAIDKSNKLLVMIHKSLAEINDRLDVIDEKISI